MKDRLYDLSKDIGDPELKEFAEGIGVSEKLAGLVFVGGGYESIIYLDQNLEEWILGTHPTICYTPTPPELAAILRQSDDPVIYRDHKPWLRKAQYQLSGQVQQGIWARDEFRCMSCGRYMGDDGVTLSVDHWIPLESGGPNDESNYLSLCRACNKKKGNMLPLDFCQKFGLDYEGLCRWIDLRNQGLAAMPPEHLR